MTMRVMMCLIVLLLACNMFPVDEDTSVFFRETYWLQSLQRPDGVIVDYAASPTLVTPYFANQAAMALTLDRGKHMTVERYVSWYFNHVNHPDKFGMDGTIYDYQITGQGKVVSRNEYDSADSYAATFISLLRCYYESVNWNVWYPDSTSELYPIVYGVISPSDPVAKHIYARFNQFHPDWVQLKSGDPYPWVIVGYVAVRMNDLPRAKTYYQEVQLHYLEENHFWPWNSEESGWLIRINEQLTSPWGTFLRNIPYADWIFHHL